MVSLSRSYNFKLFKGYLPQILLGTFLNNLTYMSPFVILLNQSDWSIRMGRGKKCFSTCQYATFQFWSRKIASGDTGQSIFSDVKLFLLLRLFISFYLKIISYSFWNTFTCCNITITTMQNKYSKLFFNL